MRSLIFLLLSIVCSFSVCSFSYAKAVEADGLTVEQREILLDDLAQRDPVGYEQFRLDQLHQAKSFAEFFRWATPAEINGAMGIPSAQIYLAGMGSAAVNVTVHLKSQTMDVVGGGLNIQGRKVSTGRKGFPTPEGCTMAAFGEAMHYSKEYSNAKCMDKCTAKCVDKSAEKCADQCVAECGAPMPYSIFFSGGAALHEGDVRVKSHGCVHLDHNAAVAVFNAYQKNPYSFEVCVVSK